jgi:hypothetical protein
MRAKWTGPAIVLLAGCGQASDEPRQRSEQFQTFDAQEAPPAAPGIAVTAAPGVAFNYRYAFRLPPAVIAATQEAHAQACEKLGLARCRITGMRYRVLGENDVEAMLAFKLEPGIARQFGKTGIDAVGAAKGKLVDAEITGTDAGAEIAAQARVRAQATDEVRRIEGELAKAGRSAAERAALQTQRAELQRRLEASNASTTQQLESLANTPMTFEYESGPTVRGFDASAPLTSALDTAAASAQITLAFLLGAVAVLGPPALVGLAIWLLWRRFGRRRAATRAPAE